MEELVRSVEEMRDLLVSLQSSPEDPQLLQSLLSGRYLPYSIPTVNCPKSTPFLVVVHIHIYGIQIQIRAFCESDPYPDTGIMMSKN
jgi:hypothetical protein